MAVSLTADHTGQKKRMDDLRPERTGKEKRDAIQKEKTEKRSLSHKLSKKNKTEMEYTELIREVIEYLLAAVLVILCVVVPLYARDGYHQIGNAKFEA